MNLLIILTAQYLYIMPIIYFALTLIFSRMRRPLIILSLLAFFIDFAFVKLLGSIISSPRPFVSEHIHPLISHVADNGFPSDHTLLTMTIAAVIFTFNKKVGITLALISVAVGISRILAHIHHPIDILGAIGIAIFSVTCSWYILKRVKLLFNL